MDWCYTDYKGNMTCVGTKKELLDLVRDYYNKIMACSDSEDKARTDLGLKLCNKQQIRLALGLEPNSYCTVSSSSTRYVTVNNYEQEINRLWED